MTFLELKKNTKKDFSGFKKIKLALLGDTATQFFAIALRGTGYCKKMDIDIFESDYNQIDNLVMNISSELYGQKPDFTVVFESSHKLLQKYNKIDVEERNIFADNQFGRIRHLSELLLRNSKTKIIWLNFPEIDDCIFGNYSNKVQSSFLYQQRKLNLLISDYAMNNADFNICDISSIQNRFGRNFLFSPPIYINTDSVINIDALPSVSESVVQIVSAAQGQFKKCLIVDLDNTIWGGIIGDDGLDNIQIGPLGIGKAFTEFQYWIKKLRQRGIIICVCSKNTESIAKEPFEKHADMVLKLEDIAVFMANWNNKVDNIKSIQAQLNISFDSMVFIDDNPFERDIVRGAIPGITVPDLPKDPALYLEYLYSLDLFETNSFSATDIDRTKQYQLKAKLEADVAFFENESDFLKSLNMVSSVQHFNSYSIPRVAQLSQRSNQFNLRTVRYTENDIKQIAESDRYITFVFTLEDKYGDNGIISAVILEKKKEDVLFIDTWFMSCRVLKRGVEYFVLNTIADYAKKNNLTKIVGEYIPTSKNALVKDHYESLGFTSVDNLWELNLAEFKNIGCFIAIKKEWENGKR